MEAWKDRTELLVGAEGLERLFESSVSVIGLGGVGAYAAEMLCRAGVGHLIFWIPMLLVRATRTASL